VPRFLNPDTMPMPASNYVQMVETEGHPRRSLIISGQIGVAGRADARKAMSAQAEQAWRNALAGLAKPATCKSPISLRSVSMTSRREMSLPIARLRDRMLQGHAPASTYVIVAGLAQPDLLTEIEVEAFSER
jgi:2-iminobutanoate/2-iminopropanoate deaminase